MEAIQCRSPQEIYEDGLVEIHTRLVKWRKELLNAKCFDWRDREWKESQLPKLDGLIRDLDNAICNEGKVVDLWLVETLGIKYSSMLRY